MNNIESFLTIPSYHKSIFEIIDFVKAYILSNNCAFLKLDISRLNLIDASKVVLLCSTFHYTKYQQGKIKFVVANEEIEKIIEPLLLKNTDISLSQPSSSNNILYINNKISTSLIK